GAFAYSAQLLIMRRIGTGESRFFIFLCGGAVSFLISVPFLFTNFIMPTPQEFALFAFLGVTGSIGLLAISYAFQTAPSASSIAPYHYTQIIWGAILGYLLFGDVPDSRMMTGAAAIIISGLYLVYGETRRPIMRTGGM